MRDGVFGRVVVPLMLAYPGAVTVDNWRTLTPSDVRLMQDHVYEVRRRRGK